MTSAIATRDCDPCAGKLLPGGQPGEETVTFLAVAHCNGLYTNWLNYYVYRPLRMIFGRFEKIRVEMIHPFAKKGLVVYFLKKIAYNQL